MFTDQIKSDGNTPWCFGIEAGSATGWPATDWLEDEMLRTAGPDTYDKWVSHAIPFNDASVKKLIARAKKRGIITVDELNDALPSDQMSPDQIEDVMSALNEMGVQVVESAESSDDDEEDDKEQEASTEDEATWALDLHTPRRIEASRAPSPPSGPCRCRHW